MQTELNCYQTNKENGTNLNLFGSSGRISKTKIILCDEGEKNISQ